MVLGAPFANWYGVPPTGFAQIVPFKEASVVVYD